MATIEEMLRSLEQNQPNAQKTPAQMLAELEAAPPTPAVSQDQSLMQWLKGGRKEETIPMIQGANLNLPRSKAAQMTALLATTASDDRLQSGIKSIIPEATFNKDQYGNLVVVAPIHDQEGNPTQQFTRFYPNPKGLNAVDVMQAAGALSLGEAIALTGGAIGLPTSGLLGGAFIGGTDAALVELMSSKLTDDPYQIFDVPLGMIGGAAGAKAAQVLGNLIQRLKTTPSSVLDKSGNLKPEVRKVLEDAGLDPDGISAELAAAISRDVAQVGKPQAAASVAAAQSLPVPATLTRGQASGLKSQQLFEDALSSGQLGTSAETLMQKTADLQQGQLGQNLEQIRYGLGGARVDELGTASAMAQEALAQKRKAEQRIASQMFTEAEQAGSAFVTPNVAGEMADNMRGVLRGYNPSETTATSQVISEMEEILASSGDIKSLFQLRQRLVNTGSAGSQEQRAASLARKEFDRTLEKYVDQELLSGSSEAVTKQIAAIRNYAEFASRWKSDGILNKLTEKSTISGTRTFTHPPENVANYLFGAKGSKLVAAGQMTRDLLTLKKELPIEQWNELRQEAFLLMANRAKGAVDNQGRAQISGAKFQSFWNDMRTNNPSLVRGLFSKEEIETISKFASVASRMTSGAKNYSNTANMAGSLLNRLARGLGNTSIAQLAIRAPLIRGITEAVGATSALRATQIPLGVRPYGQAAGLGGAAMAGDVGGNMGYDFYENVTGARIPR